MLEYSRDTKISNFDRPVLIHKYVLSFQISVQDFTVVNMFDSEGHLNEPI